MDKLVFENVNKKYGKVVALQDFSLSIKEHEFIVILGTSGSGKSTLLRILSGLDNAYSGDIFLDGKPLSDIEIRDRKTALMFQTYALYPQMSAYQNLTLPLKQDMFYKPVINRNGEQALGVDNNKIEEIKIEIANLERNAERKAKKKELKEEIKRIKKNPSVPLFSYQRLSDKEIEERIDKIKGILDLNSFMGQRVSTLSGGQKQRIALGKALLKEPEILLMDEPLSNLDAKLRAGSRELIRRVHQKANATTILVSHDQNDAYAMADRLVILDNGVIQQVGTVDEIYNHPNNVVAARFLGNPSMNLINCCFDGIDLKTKEDSVDIPITEKQKDRLKNYINKEVILGIRPEEIKIVEASSLKARYERSEIYGKEMLHHVFLNEEEILIRCKDKLKEPNKEIGITFNEDKVMFFDSDTEEIID